MIKPLGAAVLMLGSALVLSACTSGTDAASSPSESAPAATSAAATAAASPETSVAASSPAASAADSPAADLGPITVGAFNFTESQILAELYAAVLDKAGYDATITQSTNREVLEPALEAGEVQVVPEYLSTLTEFLNVKANGPDATPVASSDADATYAAGKGLAEPLGITLLTPSTAEDVNAFAVSREFSDTNNVKSLSDLAAWSKTNNLRLGGPPECPKRPFCQPGLESTYGMKIGEFTALDAGGPLTKGAIDQGKIDVGLLFSSDGSIADLDFVVLDDDKDLQNVDSVVPAVLTSAVTPQLTDALNALSAALTTEDLVALNKAVDIDRGVAADVAAQWLADHSLS